MTRLPALYVAAVGLVLVGLWLRLARSALPAPRADAAIQVPAAGRRATAPADAVPATDYESIVAANIFSQTRVAPSVRFVPAGQAVKRAAAPAAPRGPTLKLYGITLSPQGAVALIDADPKVPGAEIYHLGDLVAGARLVAITDSSVTLAKPSGPLVLRLPPARRRLP